MADRKKLRDALRIGGTIIGAGIGIMGAIKRDPYATAAGIGIAAASNGVHPTPPPRPYGWGYTLDAIRMERNRRLAYFNYRHDMRRRMAMAHARMTPPRAHRPSMPGHRPPLPPRGRF